MERPTKSQKVELVRCLFNADLREDEVDEYSHYFEDCHDGELDFLRYCLGEGSNLDHAAQNYEHYLFIVESLGKYRNMSRPAIRRKIAENPKFSQRSELALNNTFDSIFRQWLMLNARNRAEGLIFTPHSRCIRWNDETTLLGFVKSQFLVSNRLPPQRSRPRLRHSFTAKNLKSYSSIEVTWTYCLADHLKYNSEHRTVSIFANRKILWNLLRDAGYAFSLPRERPHRDQKIEPLPVNPHTSTSKATNGCCCHSLCQTAHPRSDPKLSASEDESFIPKDFLQETIWTIELLFPLKDKREPKWLEEKEKGHIYGTVTELMEESPPEDLYQYNYWRDRLLELYEEYNSPPPRFFVRYDRNNPLQWYAFWASVLVGVVALVFGTLVFGTIEVISNVNNMKGYQAVTFTTTVTVTATTSSTRT